MQFKLIVQAASLELNDHYEWHAGSNNIWIKRFITIVCIISTDFKFGRKIQSFRNIVIYRKKENMTAE